VFLRGASIAWTALAAMIPSGLGASLGVLVGFLGFGWLYQHLIGPSLAGNAGAGLSTFGGALVAPVYFGVRRILFAPRKAAEPDASPDSASTDARMTKVFEAVVPASTAVQESL
jgi:predicted lipid-binding transport protein (Tim44 family)